MVAVSGTFKVHFNDSTRRDFADLIQRYGYKSMAEAVRDAVAIMASDMRAGGVGAAAINAHNAAQAQKAAVARDEWARNAATDEGECYDD